MAEVTAFLKVFGPQALVGGIVYVLLRIQITRLAQDVQEIKVSIPACQKERRDVESEIQGRVTENAKDLRYLKGLKNGEQA